jgi:hypothetical protein
MIDMMIDILRGILVVVVIVGGFGLAAFICFVIAAAIEGN